MKWNLTGCFPFLNWFRRYIVVRLMLYRKNENVDSKIVCERIRAFEISRTYWESKRSFQKQWMWKVIIVGMLVSLRELWRMGKHYRKFPHTPKICWSLNSCYYRINIFWENHWFDDALVSTIFELEHLRNVCVSVFKDLCDWRTNAEIDVLAAHPLGVTSENLPIQDWNETTKFL